MNSTQITYIDIESLYVEDEPEVIVITDVGLDDKKAITAFLKNPFDNTAIQVANTNATKFKNLLNKIFYHPFDRFVGKYGKWSLEVEADGEKYYVDTDMRKTFGVVARKNSQSVKITWYRI